jgi:hypothetical protein
MSDKKFKEFVDQGVAAANNYFYTGRYANALEILSAVKQVDSNNDIVELLIQKICCEQFNIKSPDLNYYFGEHWLGQSLENKSIEIFCDQGMGDTINLLRYVKQLKKEYPNCKIVLNYYAFFNQFERLMQNQSYIDSFTPFHTKCDYHTNIMSLPCILNGIQLDIYYPVHFDKILDLPPPPQIYFEEFESLNLSDKNKIGLVWQTNIDNPLSKQKSINVELFDIFKDLDKQIKIWLALGKQIYVAGLNGDYLMKPLGNIIDLIPFADNIIYLKAVCECSKPASFSKRKKVNNDEQILVGSSDMYEPRCGKCHTTP